MFSAILRRVAVLFEQFQKRPMGGEFIDERREQALNFESGSLHGFAQLMCGVFTHMTDLRRLIGIRTFVQKENLRVVAPLKRLCDAGYTAHVGRGHDQRPAVAQNAPRFEQQVHGIVRHMLDDFPCDNEIEMFIGIRKRIPFGIEVVDEAVEIAVRKMRGLAVDSSGWSIVSSAHFTITTKTLEQRRHLYVTAELERAAGSLGRRYQRKGSGEAGQMFGEIVPPGFISAAAVRAERLRRPADVPGSKGSVASMVGFDGLK